MFSLGVKQGFFNNELPYLSFGKGEKVLVVLPGLGDAFDDLASRSFLRSLRYFEFWNDFTIYLVGRKQRLENGVTTLTLAKHYAAFLKEIIGKEVSILGISFGGFISQHLVSEARNQIRHLVISGAGHVADPCSVSIIQRWISLAEKKDKKALLMSMEEANGGGAFSLRKLLVSRCKKSCEERGSFDDFICACRAYLRHDGTEALKATDVPTLIIGGSEDRLVSPMLLEKTVSLCANGVLCLLSGGHAFQKEQRREYATRVKS